MFIVASRTSFLWASTIQPTLSSNRVSSTRISSFSGAIFHRQMKKVFAALWLTSSSLHSLKWNRLTRDLRMSLKLLRLRILLCWHKSKMEPQLTKLTRAQITLNITWNNSNRCIQTYNRSSNLRTPQCLLYQEVVRRHPVFKEDVD